MSKKKDRGEEEVVKFTGQEKFGRCIMPEGWGSEVDLKRHEDYGHIIKADRKITKEDRAYMKKYLHFLKTDS